MVVFDLYATNMCQIVRFMTHKKTTLIRLKGWLKPKFSNMKAKDI